MMTMKRRRSVKISSVTQEPAAWQNDSLHVLTCTADYLSMNDFLMKKVDAEVQVVINFVMECFDFLFECQMFEIYSASTL